MRRHVLRCCGLALALLLPGLAAGQSCGDISADAAGFGPYDYRDPKARAEDKLWLVEKAHFTRPVEALQRGESSAKPGPDLDYTLRHIPNHPRALASMARLFVRHDGQRPPGVRYPLQCWFQRAQRFAPDDGMVPMVHALYLDLVGQHGQAIDKLQEAVELEPRNPNVRYNLGLAYARRGNLDEAVAQAKVAYGAGFPLPGLKNLLASKGVWPPAD